MRIVLLASLFLIGCSERPIPESSPSAKPQVVLAANERGNPQVGYTGPDSLNYRYSSTSFTFEIGTALGKPWLTGKGEMQLGKSNDMKITIQSTSDRAYDLRLFGFSATNSATGDDGIEEIIPVAAGEQKVNVERFLIDTYDFLKR